MNRPFLLMLGLTPLALLADQPDTQRQQALINLLKHDCGSCHGLPPRGGLGPSLMPESLTDKSDETLLQIIQNGIPGTAMPPWRNFLSIDESQWLITQLRHGITQ